MNAQERYRVQARFHAADAAVHAKRAQFHAREAVRFSTLAGRWMLAALILDGALVCLLVWREVQP